MEDKKVMKFINENYESSHKKYMEDQKKKKRNEKIKTIIYILTLLVVLGFFIITIQRDTKKAIQNCMEKGHSYNYCLRDSQ